MDTRGISVDCMHGAEPAWSHAQRRRGSAVVGVAGFTLVELMVVLFIIGMAGVAVVMTAPTQEVLDLQGNRFAAHLAHARDEAILGGRTIEVTVTPQGYGFTRQDFGDWTPMQSRPFGNVMWADGVQPQLPRGQEQLSFRFDPSGAATRRQLSIRHGRQAFTVEVDAAGKVQVDAFR